VLTIEQDFLVLVVYHSRDPHCFVKIVMKNEMPGVGWVGVRHDIGGRLEWHLHFDVGQELFRGITPLLKIPNLVGIPRGV
jgi:hypothetical protein